MMDKIMKVEVKVAFCPTTDMIRENVLNLPTNISTHVHGSVLRIEHRNEQTVGTDDTFVKQESSRGSEAQMKNK